MKTVRLLLAVLLLVGSAWFAHAADPVPFSASTAKGRGADVSIWSGEQARVEGTLNNSGLYDSKTQNTASTNRGPAAPLASHPTLKVSNTGREFHKAYFRIDRSEAVPFPGHLVTEASLVLTLAADSPAESVDFEVWGLNDGAKNSEIDSDQFNSYLLLEYGEEWDESKMIWNNAPANNILGPGFIPGLYNPADSSSDIGNSGSAVAVRNQPKHTARLVARFTVPANTKRGTVIEVEGLKTVEGLPYGTASLNTLAGPSANALVNFLNADRSQSADATVLLNTFMVAQTSVRSADLGAALGNPNGFVMEFASKENIKNWQPPRLITTSIPVGDGKSILTRAQTEADAAANTSGKPAFRRGPNIVLKQSEVGNRVRRNFPGWITNVKPGSTARTSYPYRFLVSPDSQKHLFLRGTESDNSTDPNVPLGWPRIVGTLPEEDYNRADTGNLLFPVATGGTVYQNGVLTFVLNGNTGVSELTVVMKEEVAYRNPGFGSKDPYQTTATAGGQESVPHSFFVAVYPESGPVGGYKPILNPNDKVSLDAGLNAPEEAIGGIIDDAGNIYLAGTTLNPTSGYDFFITRRKGVSGSPWTRTFTGIGASEERAAAMFVDNFGSVVVTGSSFDTFGKDDFLTVKYDNLGNLLWAKRFNGLGNSTDRPTSVTSDRLGNVFVTGVSRSADSGDEIVTIAYESLQGNVLWTSRYNNSLALPDRPVAMAHDGVSTLLVTGVSRVGNNDEIVTVAYNSLTGGQNWVKVHASALNDSPSALTIDGGFAYIAANIRKSTTSDDVVVLKYAVGDGSTPSAWDSNRATITSPLQDRAEALAVRAGFVYVTGSLRNSATGEDLFLVRFDANTGAEGSSRQIYAGAGRDVGKAISFDRADEVYVAGTTFNQGAANDFILIKASKGLSVARWDVPEFVKGNAGRNDELVTMKVNVFNEILLAGTTETATGDIDLFYAKYTQPNNFSISREADQGYDVLEDQAFHYAPEPPVAGLPSGLPPVHIPNQLFKNDKVDDVFGTDPSLFKWEFVGFDASGKKQVGSGTFVIIGANDSQGKFVPDPRGIFQFFPYTNFHRYVNNGVDVNGNIPSQVDSFQYRVTNTKDNRSSTRTISVAVNPLNDPPTAGNDQLTARVGSPLDIRTSILLANDTVVLSNPNNASPFFQDREDDDLQVVSLGVLNPDGSYTRGNDFTTVKNGRVTFDPGTRSIRYVPPTVPQNDTDEFYYVIEDQGDVGSRTGSNVGPVQNAVGKVTVSVVQNEFTSTKQRVFTSRQVDFFGGLEQNYTGKRLDKFFKDQTGTSNLSQFFTTMASNLVYALPNREGFEDFKQGSDIVWVVLETAYYNSLSNHLYSFLDYGNTIAGEIGFDRFIDEESVGMYHDFVQEVGERFGAIDEGARQALGPVITAYVNFFEGKPPVDSSLTHLFQNQTLDSVLRNIYAFLTSDLASTLSGNLPVNFKEVVVASAVDSKGDLVIAGYVETIATANPEADLGSNGSNVDWYVAKYSRKGTTTIWERRLDGGSKGVDKPTSIAIDSNDDVIVAGTMFRSNTANDGAVVKLSGIDGKLAWIPKFADGIYRYDGGAGNDAFNAIVIDRVDRNSHGPNAIYVAGATTRFLGGITDAGLGNDYLTHKLKSDGSTVGGWPQFYNGRHNDSANDLGGIIGNNGLDDISNNNDDIATGIALDQVGSVYVSGASQNVLADRADGTPKLSYTVATLKYSPTGGNRIETLRLNQANSGISTWPASIKVVSPELFYVAATDGEKGVNSRARVISYTKFPRSTSGLSGYNSATVTFPQSGDTASSQPMGYVTSMDADRFGNVVITGALRENDIAGVVNRFSDTTDLFVVKYNALLQRQWKFTHGVSSSGFQGVNANTATRSRGNDVGNAVVMDNAGDVYVAGTSFTDLTTNEDLILLKLASAPNGAGAAELVWPSPGISRINGSGNGDDFATTIALDQVRGDVFIGGAMKGARTDLDIAVARVSQNLPPVAVPNVDLSGLNFDRSSSEQLINVTNNDTDPDLDDLSVKSIDQSAGKAPLFNGNPAPAGMLRLNNGQLYFTPSVVGLFEFYYTATDGIDDSATSAKVAINIFPVIEPPTAVDDITDGLNTLILQEGDTFLATQLLANDAPGDAFISAVRPLRNESNRISEVLKTTLGTVELVSLEGVNHVKYSSPAVVQPFDDIFAYTIRRPDSAATSTAFVLVRVTPRNEPPVTGVDTLTVRPGGSLKFSAAQLTANDSDPENNRLTVGLLSGSPVTGALGGVLTQTGAYFSYVAPSGGAVGDREVYTYTVSDGFNPPVAGSLTIVIKGAYTTDRTAPWTTKDAARFDGLDGATDAPSAIARGLDRNKNIYVTGKTYTFENQFDILTLEYNPEGGLVRKYAGIPGFKAENDEGIAVSVDSADNVYVTGVVTGVDSAEDIITIKYNKTGGIVWSHRYTTPDHDVPVGMVVDRLGNAYVVGFTRDNSNNHTSFILKYASGGASDSGHIAMGNFDGKVVGVALDPVAERIFATGTIVNSGPSQIFLHAYAFSLASPSSTTRGLGAGVNGEEALAIAIDNQGGVFVAGYSINANAAKSKDYLLVRYNPAGSEVSAITPIDFDNSEDIATHLTVDPFGDLVYVTGSTRKGSNKDFLTMAFHRDLSLTGSPVWTDKFDGSFRGDDVPVGIGADDAGSVYVAGSSQTAGGDADYLVIRYEADGSRAWRNDPFVYPLSENTQDDVPVAMVVNGGAVYITGYTDGDTGRDIATVQIKQTLVPALTLDTTAKSVNEDSNTGAIPFSVSKEGETESLVVTARLKSPSDVVPEDAVQLVNLGGGNYTLTITPAPDKNGQVRIVVSVDDSTTVVSREFDVNVIPMPDVPVGRDDSYAATEEQTLAVDQLNGVIQSPSSSDSDADGEVLKAVLIAGPANAESFTLNEDGSFTFKAAPNFYGADFFTYRPNDGTTPAAQQPVVTVSLAVSNVPDAPVGVADAYGVTINQDLTVAAPGVLANDSDPDNLPPANAFAGLTAQIGPLAPTKGFVTLNDNGSFVYRPNAGTKGTDKFNYRITDGTATSGLIEVTLTIVGPNLPPDAKDDSLTANEDTQKDFLFSEVLGNDTDDETPANQLVLTEVTAVHDCQVSIVAGKIQFKSTDNFFTAGNSESDFAVFTYKVSDGTQTSTASVKVNIAGINDKPTITVQPSLTVLESADDVAEQPLKVVLDFNPGPRESDAVKSYQVTVISESAPNMFKPEANNPSMDNAGNLKFKLNPHANGSAVLSVTVVDNGGTANGGVDTSDAQQFTLNITPTQDDSLFSRLNYSVGSGPVAVATAVGPGNKVNLIAVANFGEDTISVLKLVGGNFQLVQTLLVKETPTSTSLMAPVDVAMGDINNDGLVDLVTANSANDSISIFMGVANQPAGPFNPSSLVRGVGLQPSAVLVKHLNADSMQDIAVANEGDGVEEGSIMVLLTRPDGAVGTPVEQMMGVGPVALLSAKLEPSPNTPSTTTITAATTNDLVTANFDAGGISIRLGTTVGTYSSRVAPEILTGVNPIGLAAFNRSGLGVQDLLVVHGSRQVSYLKSKPAAMGTFESPQHYTLGSANTRLSGVAVGKITAGDQDGDIVVVDRINHKLYLMIGRGDGTFGGPDIYGTEFGPIAVTAADIFGDSGDELIVVNRTINTISIFQRK